MSLDTDTNQDLLTQVLEELDFPIRCVVRIQPFLQIGSKTILRYPTSKQCPNEAVAQLRCRGCGDPGVICAEHRSLLLASAAVSCSKCQASGPALIVFDFTPIA